MLKYALLIASACNAQISPLISLNSPFVAPAPPSGMSVWYSADCITFTSSVCGTPSNGTNITTWADRSGNANNATVTTGTCTFHTSQINSQPAITTNSTCGASLTSSIAVGAGLWTIFAVIKVTTLNANGWLFGCTSGQCLAYVTNFSSKEQAFDRQDFGGYGGAGNAAQDSNWHQENLTLSNLSSGNAYSFRLDRASDGSGTPAGGSAITNPITAILWNPNASGFNFPGQVAELILYTSILSGSQITTVESYLHNKYGL